jgi:hypothetical protein
MLPPYSTLIRLTWRQYIGHFDVVLYGHILISLPLVLAATYVKGWFPLPADATTLTELWPNFWIQLGVDQVFGLLGSIVGIMIVLSLQHEPVLPVKFSALCRQALPLYLPLILLNTLELIATAIGLSLFIVPGVLVAVSLTFATPAFIWHRFSIRKAIRYSWQLVRGQFLLVLFYVLMAQLLISGVILLVTWSLPTTFYFNVFASWISMMAASFYLVFVTVMMSATETLAQMIPQESSDKK